MFFSEQLDSVPKSSAAARRVVERLDGKVDEAALANLRLLVSELVSNAVEHAAGTGGIALEVELRDGMVHLEVSDAGAGFTHRPRQAGDPIGSGWGLHFVELLTERWGTSHEGRSRVWFELPARTPARPA